MYVTKSWKVYILSVTPITLTVRRYFDWKNFFFVTYTLSTLDLHFVSKYELLFLTRQFLAWCQQTEISCLQMGHVPWVRTAHTLKWVTTRFIRMHSKIWQPRSRQRHAWIKASIHFFMDDSWLFYKKQKSVNMNHGFKKT